jgi:hypothetical protein
MPLETALKVLNGEVKAKILALSALLDCLGSRLPGPVARTATPLQPVLVQGKSGG